MAFNSFSFLVLLGVTFALFQLLPARARPWLLLTASVAFYASWSVPFLALPLAVAASSFLCAQAMARCEGARARKSWLAAGVAVNLGVLGLFKYSAFLLETVRWIPGVDDLPPATRSLALPIAISFFTFQATGYLVDVYRRVERPARSGPRFVLFVMFFPQLVAGPIERARSLLPQIEGLETLRVVGRDIVAGLRLIAWGFLFKCVLADNLALVVDPVFQDVEGHTSGWHVAATYAFTLQLFFDFAGYTYIARGSARLFGIDLVENFRHPFLAKDPQDLWRRWHISLSEWFRDYLYRPLGGNRCSRTRTAVNLTLTMALAGLWHGAAAHFLVWGLYHGVLLALYRVVAPVLQPMTARLPSRVSLGLRIGLMFHLWVLGMLLFRAQSMGDAWAVMRGIGEGVLAPWAGVASMSAVGGAVLFAGLAAVVVFFMWVEERWRPLARSSETTLGHAIHLTCCFVAIALFTPPGSPEFVYFQF